MERRLDDDVGEEVDVGSGGGADGDVHAPQASHAGPWPPSRSTRRAATYDALPRRTSSGTVGQVLLPVQERRAAQLRHPRGAAEEEGVQVGAAVAVATHVAPAHARELLDRGGDRDRQPPHLRGQLVGEVGEVVVRPAAGG